MYDDDQLFSTPFHSYRQGVLQEVRNKIAGASKTNLSSEDEFATALLSRYTLTELNLDMDSLRVLPHHREEESYSSDVFGDKQRIVTPVYTFEINYSGSQELFNLSPGQARRIHLKAYVDSDKMSFEVKDSDKSKLEQIKEGLKFNTDNQKAEVASFNEDLEKTIRTSIGQRKQELNEHDAGLEAFGVPIKGKEV